MGFTRIGSEAKSRLALADSAIQAGGRAVEAKEVKQVVSVGELAVRLEERCVLRDRLI